MVRMLGVIGLAAALFLGANGLAADDKDEKKDPPRGEKKSRVDLEALFKKLDKDGDGKLSLEEFKKLEEFYRPPPRKGRFGEGGFGGGFDPEKLKKMLERFGKGGKGGFDPERLKKMLERLGGQGGFDPEMLKKLIEQFRDRPAAGGEPDKKKAPAKKDDPR